ncbi:unnamed protein product [Hymenolepis diminuta]|uniref:Uncharacterized protein n=1 Tax=Hymenolepis diminuta TaxID=6216 RepID=A0A564YIH9_HYMDI|nr:unnamed protein product [Hymenolepis diminuta]
MFSRGLTQVTHIKPSLFSTQKRMHACQLSSLMPPLHLLSSSACSHLSFSSLWFP